MRVFVFPHNAMCWSVICDCHFLVQIIKLCSCSSQLIMKFIMLINVKMPTVVRILSFISIVNTSENLKAKSIFLSILVFSEQLRMKSFITSGPGHTHFLKTLPRSALQASTRHAVQPALSVSSRQASQGLLPNQDSIYKLHENQHHKPYQDQQYKQRDMYYYL